ncbi:MAG: glycosyltransferase [Phormidesmis sp.]
MFFSVVIPTYNRQPILEKCLRAMENQTLRADGSTGGTVEGYEVEGYEIVLVDDGSTDGTVEWIRASADEFPHVALYEQNHKGAAIARNFGVEQSKGDTIIFIDSDLVVLDSFLQHHADALNQAYQRGNARVFTYGRVVNTCNFDAPTSEPFKVTDYSRAFFATGNVAIAKKWLIEAGLFDAQFTQYGWEDLELGVRLKNNGLSLIKCPESVGYHWHPAFSVESLPKLIDQEIQRARMGVVFYQKHPTLNVRLMIQMTWLHRVLWGVLSLGGLLNEKTLGPTLRWLIDQGYPQLSQELSRVFLNWYNVNAVYAAYKAAK